MNKYEVVSIVGEGAYGTVLKCKNKVTNEVVAIKKFKVGDDDDVVRKISLREVKILKSLQHENIVQLREVFRRKGRLNLVFEFVEKSMLDILEANPDGVDIDTVRILICQLVRALSYLHSNNIIHRDIKPENLLINPIGNVLRLCDFGFARTVQPDSVLTDYVATRWYRSPELLLGCTNYGKDVDMWATGCIMGELSDGQPLFAGESEVDQLFLIQKSLGPLTPAHMKVFLKCPRFEGVRFPDVARLDSLQARYKMRMAPAMMQLLLGVLVMEPSQRVLSHDALRMPWLEGCNPPSVASKPRVMSKPDEQLSRATSLGQQERVQESFGPPRTAFEEEHRDRTFSDFSRTTFTPQSLVQSNRPAPVIPDRPDRLAGEDAMPYTAAQPTFRDDLRGLLPERQVREEPRGVLSDRRTSKDLLHPRAAPPDQQLHKNSHLLLRDDLRGTTPEMRGFPPELPSREDSRGQLREEPRLMPERKMWEDLRGSLPERQPQPDRQTRLDSRALLQDSSLSLQESNQYAFSIQQPSPLNKTAKDLRPFEEQLGGNFDKPLQKIGGKPALPQTKSIQITRSGTGGLGVSQSPAPKQRIATSISNNFPGGNACGGFGAWVNSNAPPAPGVSTANPGAGTGDLGVVGAHPTDRFHQPGSMQSQSDEPRVANAWNDRAPCRSSPGGLVTSKPATPNPVHTTKLSRSTGTMNSSGALNMANGSSALNMPLGRATTPGVRSMPSLAAGDKRVTAAPQSNAQHRSGPSNTPAQQQTRGGPSMLVQGSSKGVVGSKSTQVLNQGRTDRSPAATSSRANNTWISEEPSLGTQQNSLTAMPRYVDHSGMDGDYGPRASTPSTLQRIRGLFGR